jgi:hypothetical protein
LITGKSPLSYQREYNKVAWLPVVTKSLHVCGIRVDTSRIAPEGLPVYRKMTEMKDAP